LKPYVDSQSQNIEGFEKKNGDLEYLEEKIQLIQETAQEIKNNFQLILPVDKTWEICTTNKKKNSFKSFSTSETVHEKFSYFIFEGSLILAEIFFQEMKDGINNPFGRFEALDKVKQDLDMNSNLDSLLEKSFIKIKSYWNEEKESLFKQPSEIPDNQDLELLEMESKKNKKFKQESVQNFGKTNSNSISNDVYSANLKPEENRDCIFFFPEINQNYFSIKFSHN